MPCAADAADAAAASGDARPPLTTKRLKPGDIDSDEMDELIMRIFREAGRQLAALEKKNTQDLDPADRARHARILASLQCTVERLARIEAGRAAARKSTASVTDDDRRAAIQRKLTRIADVERSREAPEAAHE
jgi:hypothetical protein